MWELVLTFVVGSLLFGALLGGWIMSGIRPHTHRRH